MASVPCHSNGASGHSSNHIHLSTKEKVKEVTESSMRPIVKVVNAMGVMERGDDNILRIWNNHNVLGLVVASSQFKWQVDFYGCTLNNDSGLLVPSHLQKTELGKKSR